MRRTLVIAIGALFAALVGTACADDPFSPYVVLSGSDSGISAATCLEIASTDAWRALWTQHTTTLGKTPLGFLVQKPPVVDFRTCRVIAILGGSTWNTEGLRFITGTAGETEIVIGLDWLTYQSMEAGDKVTPYGFLVIPRTEKTIRIQFDTRNLQERSANMPPKWKDYLMLPNVISPK